MPPLCMLPAGRPPKPGGSFNSRTQQRSNPTARRPGTFGVDPDRPTTTTRRSCSIATRGRARVPLRGAPPGIAVAIASTFVTQLPAGCVLFAEMQQLDASYSPSHRRSSPQGQRKPATDDVLAADKLGSATPHHGAPTIELPTGRKRYAAPLTGTFDPGTDHFTSATRPHARTKRRAIKPTNAQPSNDMI